MKGSPVRVRASALSICRENVQTALMRERGVWNTLEHRSAGERGIVACPTRAGSPWTLSSVRQAIGSVRLEKAAGLDDLLLHGDALACPRLRVPERA
jgi:hypothetical protein